MALYKYFIIIIIIIYYYYFYYSIMPNRLVREQHSGEMEREFPIKPGQPIGIALTTFYSSSEFPNKGKEPLCQK